MTLEGIKKVLRNHIGVIPLGGHNYSFTLYFDEVAKEIESICKQEIEDAKRQAKIEGLGMFLKELNPYQMAGELNGVRAQRDADLMMKVQIAISELSSPKEV